MGPLDQAQLAVADKSELVETKAERLQSRGCGTHCRTKRCKRKVAYGGSVRSASQQRPDGSSSTSRTKDGVYTKPIHRLSPVCLLESVDNEQDLIGDQPINGMVGTGGVF